MNVVLLLCVVAAFVGAFAPFDLAPLGWVALVPWCFLARRASGRKLALLGYLGGAGILLGGCHWLALTSPVNLVLMVAVESLYYALFALALRRATVGLGRPDWLALALLLPALEWSRRAFPLEGFPWLFLGVSQHSVAGPLGLARFGGVYLVSAWCGLTAGAIVALLRAGSVGTRLRRAALPLLLVVVGVVAGSRRPDVVPLGHPRFLLVQANIPQALKNAGRVEPVPTSEVLRRYTEGTQRGLESQSGPIDAVLWPETMLPLECARGPVGAEDSWYEYEGRRFLASHFESERQRYFRLSLGPLLRAHDTRLIAGVTTHAGSLHSGDHQVFNSAVLFDDEGAVLSCVDKVLRVPGGEYLPIGWLPQSLQDRVVEGVRAMAGFVPDLSAGSSVRTLAIPDGAGGESSLGVSICYEIAYPDHQRALVDAGAEILVNLSNEAWFPESAEYAQYTALASLRAVECGRAVVRCANSGESGYLDRDGSRHLLETEGRTHDVALHGAVSVPRYGDRTFWVEHGRSVLAGLLLGAVILLCPLRPGRGGSPPVTPGASLSRGSAGP